MLRRTVAESAIVVLGCLLIGAAAAGQRWLDARFLPSFSWSHQMYVLLVSLARVAIAALALWLILKGRKRIGRALGIAVAGLLAFFLALGAGELALRRISLRAAEEQPPDQEPRRRSDPRLGWLFVPARSGHHTAGGREVEYAFDPAGYRVRRIGEAVDPDRPAIVFTGESTIVGHGLEWEESVPAQVERVLGIQSANIAVHGFATDQAYLRLHAELPRFRQPLAVVAFFAPVVFDRNLDEDRPHLSADLVWYPAKPQWRLTALAKFLIPYRSEEAIERGIAVTQAALRATVELARQRGAVALILVPIFRPDETAEQTLRRRILDQTNLPYVAVEIDPAWRIPWDGHPDPRAARAMALAVAARLRQEGIHH